VQEVDHSQEIEKADIVSGDVTTGGAASAAVRASSANHPKLNGPNGLPAWWQGR
jgi:hypothetical protein